MKDKSKTQPKAFRITEETADKFKEIAQSLGSNQEQALAKLIEVYETEMCRTGIPEARENIDTFEGYMRVMGNMYMQALESNQNMRALVRAEYEAQLKSKDRIIEDLQHEKDEAMKISAGFLDKEREYQEQISDIETERNSLEKQLKEERAASGKELAECEKKYEKLKTSYTNLQSSDEETKSMLSSFMKENEKLKEENEKYRTKNHELENEVFSYGRKNQSLEGKMEQVERMLEEERANRSKELEQYKKNCELEHRLAMKELESELNAQHKAEMDEARKELDKYRELYYKQEDK